METQTWLSGHYKFISAENISILSVSSDDFFTCCSRSCRNICMFNTQKKKVGEKMQSFIIQLFTFA